MLIKMPADAQRDSILSHFAELEGKNPSAVEERVGIYRVTHFGSTHFLRAWNHYPDFVPLEVNDDMPAHMKEDAYEDLDLVQRSPYGVCDNVDQLLKHFPELEASDRMFVVTLTEVRKDEQPNRGGWRWHKWGPYIGSHTPAHEYLYDEKDIEAVFVYHIYEYLDYDRMTDEELVAHYERRFYTTFSPECRHWKDTHDQRRNGLIQILKGLA